MAEIAPTPAAVSVVPVADRSETPLARRLLRSGPFVVGTSILALWVFDAIFWRALVPHNPQAISQAVLKGPSSAHLLGTDNLGRDVFSRLLAGSTSVLTIAVIATIVSLTVGTAIGLFTAYYRGILDEATMRVVDALLAFPVTVIAVLVLAVLGPSNFTVVVVLGILFAPVVARTARSAALAEREQEYVASAQLRGESGIYIMAREILPNILGPLSVEAVIRLGYAVFTSATLSFLGFGVRQPSPDWGLSVSLGEPYIQIAPWMVLGPALALASLVVALNLVADGVREVVES